MSRSPSTSRWVALFLWIFVIFVFSTDSFSDARTSGVIVPLLKFLLPFLSPEQLQLGHAVCRKAGHVLEYFVLGILAWRVFSHGRSGWARANVLVMAVVFAVALSDEYHQSFVPARTGALTDVGYDFIGGIVALFLIAKIRNEARTLHSHSVL